MLFKRAPAVRWSEVTPEADYLGRRAFVRALAGAALAAPLGIHAQSGRRLSAVKSRFGSDEAQTPYAAITSYNNFYEFGADKDAPSQAAKRFKTDPWTIAVEGEVARGGRYHLEDFLKPYALEERIYRLRCVEGWSMVIPWIGVPLHDVLGRAEPTTKAAFVEFTTLLDLRQMPGQAEPLLRWPYVEGLRLDEAMHPLTILAVGLYGEVLPNQNGAPIRLVVPWKYGFKSIKSIVRIRLTDKPPRTTWQIAGPTEYGFYANVNPDVDHPRWSQGTERRIGELRRRKTLLFNGYADQVAGMYTGLDLRKNF
jgi:methionine sulfoxide reductase catalytic subunit